MSRRRDVWLAVRSVPLRPLVGTIVAALGATALLVGDRPDEPMIVLESLRLSAVLLALGLVFIWDDSAADTLASSPRTLLWRRGVRLLVGLPVLAAGWLAVVPTAHAISDDAFACTPRPDVGVTVELAGFSMLGLAVAAYASRRNRSHPGTVAAIAVVAVGATLPFLPARWTFVGGEPGSPTWTDAHLRWGVVTVVILVGLLWLSRDPAFRRVTRPTRTSVLVVLAVLFAAALGAVAFRDGGRHTALADVLPEQQALEGVPALAAAVVFPDGEIWTGASGEAATGQMAAPDQAFAQASITKLYVATLAVALEERGVVDLDAAVGEHLPELPAFADVSLRQLLSHTAGMADPEDLFTLFDDRDRVWTFADVLASAGPAPAYEPGTEFGYANVGYVAAGLVLERVTGEPLGGLLERHVLAEAGVDETWLQGPGVAPLASVAHAHLDTDGDGHFEDVTLGHALTPWTSLASAAWGAGGLVAPVGEVARFGHRLFTGELVGRDALATMIPEPGTTGWMEYGVGVMRVDVGEGGAVGHTGEMPGAATELWHLADSGLTVAVAMNATPRCGTAAQAIVEAALRAER